jgi:hypothetical protein
MQIRTLRSTRQAWLTVVYPGISVTNCVHALVLNVKIHARKHASMPAKSVHEFACMHICSFSFTAQHSKDALFHAPKAHDYISKYLAQKKLQQEWRRTRNT